MPYKRIIYHFTKPRGTPYSKTAKTQGYPYSRKTFPIDAHLVNEQVAEEKQKPEKDTAPRLCNNSQQNLHNTFAEENFPSR